MVRSVPMWVGRDDDQAPPQRVRDRVYDRFGGRCHKCTRLIGTGETWTCEHVIAITNGGANSEANLNLTCCNCLPAKNAEDAAIKRKNTQVRYAHRGIRPPSRWQSQGFAKAPKQNSATRPIIRKSDQI